LGENYILASYVSHFLLDISMLKSVLWSPASCYVSLHTHTHTHTHTSTKYVTIHKS